MKILIILPNWLGDALMATPAIEHLGVLYPEAEFTFVGSFVSVEAVKYQIMIMFLIAGGAGFGTLAAVHLSVRRLFDERERLRLDRLQR